ncbi:hypothetical protein Ppa06_64030 [Planomonospora parontospora subsp. parontospora]|uniref:Uncharacterized protein n=2 Tax=Planomonospora parontospora TaxID=58119 RepID=A0AA37F7S5_9ACTN|nr:hypothetical protein GCM10010126_63790 [Planomonospora parontospora]GII12605.1 hypothetical protein Ppa06_64030 [Planomonospora parontospora subsp. parontospora]
MLGADMDVSEPDGLIARQFHSLLSLGGELNLLWRFMRAAFKVLPYFGLYGLQADPQIAKHVSGKT